jgi:methylated-DNA-[protein]-cysteine S-methyltransferase
MPSTIDAQVPLTPAGPPALLAHDGVLVAAGFTADPGELFARLPRALAASPLQPVDARGEPAHFAYRHAK